MKELKITKEKVLEASKQCEQAREVLEAMFPEAFEGKWDNVTSQIKWEVVNSGLTDYYLVGLYEGTQVAYFYASEGIKDEKKKWKKIEKKL